MTIPAARAVSAAVRASQRAAALSHLELKRRLVDLATIASIAPWLGLLMTLRGTLGSFLGCGCGDEWNLISTTLRFLAYALARFALGLAVGTLSLLFYLYLRNSLADLKSEMDSAILELANHLAALPRHRYS